MVWDGIGCDGLQVVRGVRGGRGTRGRGWLRQLGGGSGGGEDAIVVMCVMRLKF